MSQNENVKEFTINDWREFFPLKIARKEQELAINFALDSFLNQKKKFVILDLGTGCGKSAVGITIARYLDSYGEKVIDDNNDLLMGAYVLTTQKILQQQYVDDFGPGIGFGKNLLRSIKSASNYTCCFYKEQSCAQSRHILTQLGKKIVGTEFHNHCSKGGCCQYSKDKSEFIESMLSITNFAYFLTEALHGKQIKPRNMLVIDEAHNVETQLGSHVEVTFSEKFAKEILKCKSIPVVLDQKDVFEWVQKVYKPALEKQAKVIEKQLKTKLNVESDGFAEISKKFDLIESHLDKVERFLLSYTEDNWVLNVIKPEFQDKKQFKKFEFKPVDVSKFSHDALFKFGHHVLLMSATIIDKDVFCKSIGIDTDDVGYITIPSPFPVENRPVHYIPAGSMSINNIEKTLPIMAEAIKMLIEQHNDEKGIIHCVNSRIVKYLVDKIASPRFLYHDANNREQILRDHIEGDEPTILLSPSMMEGVDLADDSSRFQILCKVPYPYLGDACIKKRMENNRSWYTYQTIKSIIQAMGRSIRNANDHAVSYILDSDWERFHSMNKKMLPIEFTKSLK